MKKINANKFNTGINSANINLIDVRTYDEFALGHIPNSINIDFNNFDEFKENIDLIDKNKLNPMNQLIKSQIFKYLPILLINYLNIGLCTFNS